MAPGIRVLLTIADLDRLAPPPCMNACPVCGSDQVHGQACIATRLLRTIARLGNRGLRRSEIPVIDAAFLKACGIAPNKTHKCGRQGTTQNATNGRMARRNATYAARPD
jgi:hypothetical protein